MSVIISIAILITVVVGICLLLNNIYRKQKQMKMNQLMIQFSRLGTKHGLSFSSQEEVHEGVMGLDGMRRKVLVLTKRGEVYNELLIDLSLVKSCSVIKHYKNITAGSLRHKKLSQYIDMIALHFDFHTDKLPVEVLFYHHGKHESHNVMEMEVKARHWEALLSKMIIRPPGLAIDTLRKIV